MYRGLCCFNVFPWNFLEAPCHYLLNLFAAPFSPCLVIPRGWVLRPSPNTHKHTLFLDYHLSTKPFTQMRHFTFKINHGTIVSYPSDHPMHTAISSLPSLIVTQRDLCRGLQKEWRITQAWVWFKVYSLMWTAWISYSYGNFIYTLFC